MPVYRSGWQRFPHNHRHLIFHHKCHDYWWERFHPLTIVVLASWLPTCYLWASRWRNFIFIDFTFVLHLLQSNCVYALIYISQSNWATDWSGAKEYLRIWSHVRALMIKDDDDIYYVQKDYDNQDCFDMKEIICFRLTHWRCRWSSWECVEVSTSPLILSMRSLSSQRWW